MHVMIATDGNLEPIRTAAIAARLAGGDGRVTVVSVVEVPRALLDDMRRAVLDGDDLRRDVEFRSTQATDSQPAHWIGDDAVVERYVRDQVRKRTVDLVAALDDRGVKHEVVDLEGENAARSLLEWIADEPVDVILIGTHGLGRFDGLLGSTSTKVARRAPCSVVLVR